ncbi:hypothetical protein F4780DRAFT_731035 [Xylariomycetidae sp. FL0641]|nr:hypothetical protein F4780DRAFT_731035 [Xylariomycetidae sp. FL0641]
MEAQQPLFGLLPAGQALTTNPTSQPSATSFLYALPARTALSPKPFAHLAVFLLPNVSLPPGTAAAIYAALNPAALAAGTEAPNFRFLGGVGPGKESAVFKLSPGGGIVGNTDPVGGAGEDIVVVGINLEDAGGVAERIQAQQAEAQAAGKGGAQPSTQVLAQRIIQNAFNFLASFSGQVGDSGVEVVPLKAFQEWWKKFESRVKSDPSFLERDQN